MPYKNKAEQKAAQREWYENNKELTQQRSNAWKKNNPDKVRAARKEYEKNNRAKVKERKRKREQRQTAELTDYYIRKELSKYGIPPAFSRKYPELIEMTREYYATIRLLQKMNKDAKAKRGRIH